MGVVSVAPLWKGQAKLLKYLGTAKATSNMYTPVDVSGLVSAAGIEPVLGDVILSWSIGRITSIGFRDLQAKWEMYPIGKGGSITDFPTVTGSSVGQILDVYYVRPTDAD